MNDPKEFDRELWLGMFAWLVVPAVMLIGFIIALGISVDWLIHFGTQLLREFQKYSGD